MDLCNIDFEWLLNKVKGDLDKIHCYDELRIKVTKLLNFKFKAKNYKTNGLNFISLFADDELDNIVNILSGLDEEIAKIKKKTLIDLLTENVIKDMNDDVDKQISTIINKIGT
jgi:hypothetical protein